MNEEMPQPPLEPDGEDNPDDWLDDLDEEGEED